MPEPALYLIPVTLDVNSEPASVLPDQVLSIINDLDEFIVENARTARRFLRRAGFSKNLDEVTMHILDKHTGINEASEFIGSLKAGKTVGLLSEAGTPCIADPGAEVVRLCQEQNIRVAPLSGPSSILLALMASGFNGQQFAFHGYLPIQKPALKNKLKQLENNILKENQTQIFIETPYRNMKLLEVIIQNCSPSLKLCIASEITTSNELIKTRNVSEWKKNVPELHKKPTVFLLYK